MKQFLKKTLGITKKVLVGNIMSRPVIGVNKDDSVHDAAKIMDKNSISTVVVSEDNKLIGIVTERDLTKKMVLTGKSSKKTKISEIMSKNPVTIHNDSPILKASNIMKKKKVRKLVVVDTEGNMAGIVSQTDIINSMNRIYDTYKSLLWDSRFYFMLFLLVSLFFLLNYILFR